MTNCFFVILQSRFEMSVSHSLYFLAYTGKLSAIYRKKTAMKGDERIRLMDEIVSGVQVIKMYAWERPFGKLINNVRKLELKTAIKASYIRGLFVTFNLFTRRASLYCTLITLALSGQQLSSSKVRKKLQVVLLFNLLNSKVFVFAMYFNIISQTMSLFFVRGVAELAELFVGIQRIQEFLMSAEFAPRNQLCDSSDNTENEEISVELQNATVKWSPASTENALSNLNILVQKGSLLGVIGPVGSGKTTLLQTILGKNLQ